MKYIFILFISVAGSTIYAQTAKEYYKMGIKNNKNGNYYGAIENFNKAIALNPSYDSAYYSRGFSKFFWNGWDDSLKNTAAIEDYTKAIALNPAYAEAYFSRGLSKFYSRDYKGAIEDFMKTIALNPNHAEAHYRKGLSEDTLKDYKSAIEDYTKVIEAPDYIPNYVSEAYTGRGNCKYKLGDHKGAAEDYYSVGVRRESHTGGYFYAIEEYDKAIKSDPTYDLAYYNRANAKLNLGDKAGACLDWKKASELGNKDAAEAISENCK